MSYPRPTDATDVAAAEVVTADVVAPGDRRRAASWLLGIALLLAVVTFDQGLVSGGTAWAHELAHDARHLLGVPCH